MSQLLLNHVHQEKNHTWLSYEELNSFPIKGLTILKPTTNPSIQDEPKHQQFAQKKLNAIHSISLNQVHGRNIYYHSNSSYLQSSPEADAIISQQKNTAFVIRHADCQAVIIYDPENHALAMIHCGWKGNVLNILDACIRKMKKHFSSNPQQLIACFSPSLGKKHAQFIHCTKELPSHFDDFEESPLHFNLKKISLYQLLEAGLLEKNIHISPFCTYENKDLCFSYRRDKDMLRHLTLACLQ